MVGCLLATSLQSYATSLSGVSTLSSKGSKFLIKKTRNKGLILQVHSQRGSNTSFFKSEVCTPYKTSVHVDLAYSIRSIFLVFFQCNKERVIKTHDVC